MQFSRVRARCACARTHNAPVCARLCFDGLPEYHSGGGFISARTLRLCMICVARDANEASISVGLRPPSADIAKFNAIQHWQTMKNFEDTKTKLIELNIEYQPNKILWFDFGIHENDWFSLTIQSKEDKTNEHVYITTSFRKEYCAVLYSYYPVK